MDNILAYKQELGTNQERFFDEQYKGIDSYWHQDLVERLRKYMRGGKHMRGCLVCFSHDLFDGQHLESAYQAGLAIELTHTAFLIHDDIMDRDDIRRDQPAMHKQYQQIEDSDEHYGIGMAICAGDSALFMAQGLLSGLDISSQAKTDIGGLASQVLTTLCTGQMLDFDLGTKDKDVSKQEILEIMRQKTALYSLSLPLASGAIIADQPKEVVDSLCSLGEKMGIIYQIRDDELDVSGDPHKGREPGSDVREDKKTLFRHYLFSKCSIEEKTKLKKIFGNQAASSEDINYVRQLNDNLGVLAAINDDVNDLYKQAEVIIAELPIDKSGKDDLVELLDYCAKRS